MKLLATDLDRTLLPNGEWHKDENAISLFNSITKEDDNLVVLYVTGRSLKLTEQAVSEFQIRYPHILISDVGTAIKYYKNGIWVEDASWRDLVYKKSPKWDIDHIKELLTGIEGLREQEKEKLNEFKQSYYVAVHLKEGILKEVNERIKNKFDEEIVYSYDPLINKGLLDILPKAATKKTALFHIIDSFKLDLKDVLYCGDSGNDILPLTSGVNAVLVRNADEETQIKVKDIMKKTKMQNRLYIAKGNFKGMNGNYTSGVIEGAYHFGFLK